MPLGARTAHRCDLAHNAASLEPARRPVALPDNSFTATRSSVDLHRPRTTLRTHPRRASGWTARTVPWRLPAWRPQWRRPCPLRPSTGGRLLLGGGIRGCRGHLGQARPSEANPAVSRPWAPFAVAGGAWVIVVGAWTARFLPLFCGCLQGRALPQAHRSVGVAEPSEWCVGKARAGGVATS